MMDLLDLYFQRTTDIENKILVGDCKEILSKVASNTIDTCVTSPPYYKQRDYEVEGQLGQEESLDEYIQRMVQIFREVRRVLKPEGSLWLNLGDTYMNKQLLGVPWRVAFALQQDGWILRADIIWEKKNCIPSSVKDRPSTIHEYIFLLTKSSSYYYNYEAIRDKAKESSIKRLKYGVGSNIKYGKGAPGQDCVHTLHKPRGKDLEREISPYCNKKSIWKVAPGGCKESHFAAFPKELIRPCIKAGCPEGGIVLDPFFGSGTTGIVAMEEGCNYLGVELNPKFAEIAENRIYKAA